MKFLDQVKIYVKAGNGGDGSLVLEEKNSLNLVDQMGWWRKWRSVILQAERNLNTLIDYRYQQHHKAKRGDNGAGQNRTGKSGSDLILKVPLGTQVFEEDNKTLIYDFVKSEKNLLLLVEAKVVWEILDLKVQLIELQENLQKDLLGKSL